jgi:transcriptional regulator with XRE-family HTH domain
MTVGQRLKQARKAAKLSGERLGAYINVSKGQISNIENGSSDLTYGNAVVLAQVLGVSPEWLLHGQEQRGGQHAHAGRDIGVQAGRDVSQGSASDCEQKLAAALREIELLRERIKDKEQLIELLLKR